MQSRRPRPKCCARAAVPCVDDCLQFFGGYGYMLEYPMRVPTSTPGAPHRRGSSEIMRKSLDGISSTPLLRVDGEDMLTASTKPCFTKVRRHSKPRCSVTIVFMIGTCYRPFGGRRGWHRHGHGRLQESERDGWIRGLTDRCHSSAQHALVAAAATITLLATPRTTAHGVRGAAQDAAFHLRSQ